MLDVVVISKANPTFELKEYEDVLIKNLKELPIKLNQKTSTAVNSTPAGKDFTIYVGYDFKILSHLFSKLDQESFFIFLGPAGSAANESIYRVVQDCSDQMECDPEAYKRVVFSWSYKEVISYVKVASNRIKLQQTKETNNSEAPSE